MKRRSSDQMDRQVLEFVACKWGDILSLPLYRSLYGSRSRPPDSIEEFRKLPPLGRLQLAALGFSERTLKWSGTTLQFVSTSGTTGDPLVVPWTDADERVARRSVRKIHKWVQWKKGDVVLVVAPLGLSSMALHMARQAQVQGATLVMPGIVPPDAIVGLIERFGATVLASLPSICLRVAELLRTKRRSTSLRMAACGGDTLSLSRRERIETLLQAPCWNFYGLSEMFGPLAGECPARSGMHFQACVYPEIEAPSRSIDGAGRLLLTTLWDRANLLVRYDAGDFASLDYSPCKCGHASVRATFLGKAEHCAVYDQRVLFPARFDDVVLSVPDIGPEWYLDLCEVPKPVLHVEGLERARPAKQVIDAIADRYGFHVRVEFHPRLMALRAQPKPHRFRIDLSGSQSRASCIRPRMHAFGNKDA